MGSPVYIKVHEWFNKHSVPYIYIVNEKYFYLSSFKRLFKNKLFIKSMLN